MLPSFLMRYRRQDTDYLGKLMELNLGMGLSLRETATIYEWNQGQGRWQPGWVWALIQWERKFDVSFWVANALRTFSPRASTQ